MIYISFLKNLFTDIHLYEPNQIEPAFCVKSINKGADQFA